MKMSIFVIGALLLLICFSLNGQTNYLHERSQQSSLFENLPFDANSVIQQVSSNNHPLPCPFSHSGCSEESQYNKWSRDGEFLIDTNMAFVRAPDIQGSPSIAFDGTNYLVVWHDYRCGSSYDIYGARVNEDGILLDTAGICISSGSNWQFTPSVCFDGTNYFVVWDDRRSGSYSDIYGARVTQSGIVLDTAGIAISTAYYWQWCPVVAYSGSYYFVAWIDFRNDNFEIFGSRITSSGIVLDTAGIRISTTGGYDIPPAIATDSTNYFVVWHDSCDLPYPYDFDIFGARINHDGIILDTAGIIISHAGCDQVASSVVFDGINYFVAWEDYRDGTGTSDIYGARVSTAGVVLDSQGLCVAKDVNWQSSPAVAFDGSNYLVVWDDDRLSCEYTDIYCARVSRSGVVIDSMGVIVSSAVYRQSSPSVVFDGINYLVAWADERNAPDKYDIYSARVSQSATILDPIGLITSTAAYAQYSPSVAFDGMNYFAVWQDLRNGSCDIYGARMDCIGNIFDPDGIAISTAPGDQISPYVIFGGTTYLVVWQDNRNGSDYDIYAARVHPNGMVLDPPGIVVSNAVGWQTSPSVSFDGANYFTVWSDYRDGSGQVDIYGARITQSGLVLDPSGVEIAVKPNSQTRPSVKFGNMCYLISWSDFADGLYDIHGVRMTPSGYFLDTSDIVITTANLVQTCPSVAFDGTDFMAVWMDMRNGVNTYDIYGTRVKQSGVVIDTAGFAISTAPGNQWYPKAVFDGINYLAIWQDFRNTASYDIYGIRLDTACTIVDSFIVSAQSGNQMAPAVARGVGSQLLITYSCWCDSINDHPANTMRIWGKFYPFTCIEETDLRHTSYTLRSLEVYPNPFKEKTSITFQLGNTKTESEKISLKIYDATGRLVRNFSQPTNYDLLNMQIIWHGDDDVGRIVPAGVYFIMAETKGYAVSKKAVLLK